MRWRLRTFLLVIGGLCLLLGAWVRPIFVRERIIRDLQRRDVWVYAERVGPRWVQKTPLSPFFRKPPSFASVLVGPVDSEHMHLLGKDFTIAEANRQLELLHAELEEKLGIEQPPYLTHDYVSNPLAMRDQRTSFAVHDFFTQHRSVVSPCGISNFPRVANKAR